MQVFESAVRAMLVAIGKKKSARMSFAKLEKAINNAESVTTLLENAEKFTPEQLALLANIGEAVEKGEKIELEKEIGPAGENGEAPPKKKSAVKKGKGKTKSKVKKERKPGESGPSNKEVVYKEWKSSREKKNSEELFKLVNEKDKLTTIRGWIGGWKRKVNLPACAK